VSFEILLSGWLKLEKPSGYLYFIKKDSYLYIGETSNWPIFRWGAHFGNQGTFINRLKEFDEEAALSENQVELIALDLAPILSEHPSLGAKRVCQAIEHDTHICIACDQDLAHRYTIISNTVRTTPTFIRLPRLRQYTMEVVRLAKPRLM